MKVFHASFKPAYGERQVLTFYAPEDAASWIKKQFKNVIPCEIDLTEERPDCHYAVIGFIFGSEVRPVLGYIDEEIIDDETVILRQALEQIAEAKMHESPLGFARRTLTELGYGRSWSE